MEQGPTPKDIQCLKNLGRNFEFTKIVTLWKNREKAMKSQWKPREKAVKNIEKPSKSGLCKTCKKNGFAILWSIFLISAPALYGCCWSYGAFFFFKVMIFLRPLVIEVLYSNGRVKLVLWTDWVSSFSWCFGQLPPSFSFHFARCSVRPRFVLAPSAAKQTKREPRNKQRLERWDRVNYISRNSD